MPETFGVIKRNIKNFRVAMTATCQLDADGTMGFFTRDDSIKVDHIQQHPMIAPGFLELKSRVSVATSGEAESAES